MTDTGKFSPETDAHGSAIGESRPVPFATRPVLQGSLGMVAAGHYLASAIGLNQLEKGGNAVDAGVAAGFALALLKPQSVGIGGESRLGTAGSNDRLVSLARDQPDPIGWFLACNRARPVCVLVYGAAQLWDSLVG